ncbi:MAG TPA: M43 family zinc metalloprotease [Bacteroidia bacterium]|nr:M43 family zinc metalloprotease [Bacteroidia bacterium]
MKKSYLKFLLINAIFLFSTLISFAQEPRCGTTEAMNELYKLNPDLLRQEAEYNAIIQQKIANKALQKSAAEDVYIIPVVFHVIHINGIENISDAQIQDQINILNRDYRKLNTDVANIIKNTPFDTLASDIKVEFRLAQLDPKGQCTNGIDRIYSTLTSFADNKSKLNPWPRDKYLNVWTVKSIGTSGNVAGYAYYPSSVSSISDAPVDGVIILADYIGSIGTSSPYHSRALTHEVGHYLNLMHVWGNTNSPEVDCFGTDFVDDTPPTRGHVSCDHKPYCTLYNFINTSYKFSGVTTASGTTDPTVVPVNTGATFAQPKATGVSANSSENGRFSFTGWDIGSKIIQHDTLYDSLKGSLNKNKYYEVTLTPKYGYSMTLTKMSFSFKRDTAGVRTYSVKSNIDNFTNNLPASIDSGYTGLAVKPGNVFFSKYDTTTLLNGSSISLTGFKNVLVPITFRIYGWNAEDSTGTFGIDSLTFTGVAGVIENTQNYMDYSYCSVMFTKGQKDRMRATLETNVASRNNLWTSANLTATGTNGNGILCKPVPDFFTNNDLNSICQDDQIIFKSSVLNSMPGSPVTLLWEFEGGTPATSSVTTPSVKYSTPGTYKVKLTATNTAGSSSVEKLAYIYVRNSGGDVIIWNNLTENFEDLGAFNAKWHIFDFSGNAKTWESANVGYNSSNSIRMNGFNNVASDADAFVSPYYNGYLLKDLKLSFKYTAGSKATLSADMNDALNVYYSTNCGSTWVSATSLKGSALTGSAGYQANNYIPTTAAQWQTKEVNIPVYNPTMKFLFKFEYITGTKSNNVYIDDINLSGTVGIDENDFAATNVIIYPNPTSDMTTLSYHLNNSAAVSVTLTDILGKQITKIDQHEQPAGDFSVNLSKEQLKLQNGIYFIKLTIGKASVTHKLVITE